VRKLPAWTPFALVSFGALLYIAQAQISRYSELADTLLEAIPFAFIFAGFAAAFWSDGRWWRWIGLGFAVLIITYPVWADWFFEAQY